ncbi:hypothetical protein V498_08572 [Pseudogymnoascus sp. VKM F-4517 (FW-2822)]|nr:hypothetical protein V498_08572 [Pseudogymnoascus sp. VKM F-4517 (FW-2822)]
MSIAGCDGDNSVPIQSTLTPRTAADASLLGSRSLALETSAEPFDSVQSATGVLLLNEGACSEDQQLYGPDKAGRQLLRFPSSF